MCLFNGSRINRLVHSAHLTNKLRPTTTIQKNIFIKFTKQKTYEFVCKWLINYNRHHRLLVQFWFCVCILQLYISNAQNTKKNIFLITHSCEFAVVIPEEKPTANMFKGSNVNTLIQSVLPDNRPITSLQIVDDYEKYIVFYN